MDKKIYVVLSQTGTCFSRAIKLYTKYNYNHTSIALDKDLSNNNVMVYGTIEGNLLLSKYKEAFEFKIEEDKVNIDENYLSSFKEYGGGRAPEGYCGAFYAAKMLLSLSEEHNIQDFEGYFMKHAGSLKCKDIRQGKRLSCLGCIEKSSEYIDRTENFSFKVFSSSM